MGYRRVWHYRGGLAEWKEAVGRVETGMPEPARATRSTFGAIREQADRDESVAPELQPFDRASAPSAVPLPSRLSRQRLQGIIPAFLDAVAERPFGWIVKLWAGAVVGFGVAYWVVELIFGRSLAAGPAAVSADWRGFLTSLYFSLVTATTLGYGDVVPVGAVRALAVAEGALGLFLFGCLVTKLVTRRQEQLMEEIHRNTFESRLGRVRTNLHMVLTEVDTMVRECETRRDPPASLLARLDSTATVFNGELRAVHDLLYRPQQVPDERVLEGILAGVAAALREFAHLLECVPNAVSERPSLQPSLRQIAEVSREICSECVPRVYAPDLTAWMDEIQGVARLLADGR